MEELIFATKNKGKLKEVKKILGDIFDVKSMEETGINIDIVEDGKTFEDNAIKKAIEIMKITGKNTLADDSGLEIDYLDKKPGVYSARYLGIDTPYTIKNQKIIDMLDGIEIKKRGARFASVIALVTTDFNTKTTYGMIEGLISSEILGSNGFGYDPIFYLPNLNKTMAQLTSIEKNKISHRSIALEKMKVLLGKK